MKKLVMLCAILLCLFCTACSDPPMDSVSIQDVDQYLEVNAYVEQKLQNEFFGILPPEEIIPMDRAEYLYTYECSVLGDPNFLIYLEYQAADDEAFQKEMDRVKSVSSDVIGVSQTALLCTSINRAYHLYTDDKVMDGLSFDFEMALFEDEDNTISYLVALQWDSHEKSDLILRFISYLYE